MTTPLRTALDLGCVLNRRDALAAMDALARAYGFTSHDLVASLPRFAGRRGVVQLRELAASGRSSRGVARRILDPARDPRPRPASARGQLVGGRRRRHRSTGSISPIRAPRSPSSTTARSSTPRDEDMAADAERRDWLERHGWTVIVVDKDSFTDEAIAGGSGRSAMPLALAQTAAAPLVRAHEAFDVRSRHRQSRGDMSTRHQSATRPSPERNSRSGEGGAHGGRGRRGGR